MIKNCFICGKHPEVTRRDGVEVLKCCNSLWLTIEEWNNLKCGCGKPARYKCKNGMSCNEVARCLTYKEYAHAMTLIQLAIFTYHLTLDGHKTHKEIAAVKFVDDIQTALGKSWIPGEALKMQKMMQGSLKEIKQQKVKYLA